MTRLPIALACALTLLACGEEPSTTDYVDEPPAPAPADRTDCQEADFAGAPLAGPGFENGVYVGPTDAPLVASSTVLYLRDTPEAGPRFEALMVEVQGALMQSEGLLGLALGGSQQCGAYRTLALWRDTDAMLAFVTSEAHYRAMAETPDIADRGSRTVHWTLDPAAEALDWAAGIDRTAAADAIEGLGTD